MNLILTENRSLRYATFTILYVAQGLPFGLVGVALPAYLAEIGTQPGAIAGFVAIAMLPWTFKIFAGPIMDRWHYLAMGRRRPWVIVAQAGLVLTGLAFAFFPDGLQNLAVLTTLCLLLNVFGASQDVAVDGMAIDVLPVTEHGRANAFMALGQTGGISGATIVSAFAVEAYGMLGVAVMLVVGFSLILAVAVAVRERPGEKLLPWTAGQPTERSLKMKAENWKDIAVDLFKVLFLPASLLMLGVAFLFRFADGLWVVLTPIVVVQELGLDSTEYSSFVSLVGLIAAVAGLALGLFLDKKGIKFFYGLAMALYGGVALVVAFSEAAWQSTTFLVTVGILQLFVFQGVFISFIASSMSLCWVRVSATQFAIYMAWANLGRSAGTGSLAFFEGLLSYRQMYLVIALTFFVGVALVWLTRFDRHRDKVAMLGDLDGTADFAPQR